MSGDYAAEDVLTAADVPAFPNGTATVYHVGTDEPGEIVLATLDARGFLRSLDDRRAVCPIDECDVRGVAE